MKHLHLLVEKQKTLVDFSGKALVIEHDNFLQIARGLSQAKYASKKPKLEVI